MSKNKRQEAPTVLASDHLIGLNPTQIAIIQATKGVVCTDVPAGSGKLKSSSPGTKRAKTSKTK